MDANVSLLAGWNVGGVRSDSNTYYDCSYYDYDEDYYYSESDVASVATVNQYMTGIKYSYRLTSWLRPMPVHKHYYNTDTF